MKTFFDIELPKWSQMTVSGLEVTTEEAKDIIFRTDEFLTDCHPYSGGNDRRFNEWYRKTAKLDLLNEFVRSIYDDSDRDPQQELYDLIGFVETEFVYNRFGSTSYIGGPAGWCLPTGEIYFTHNVGKWPTVTDLYDEWSKIAKEFPYVVLEATIHSGEEFEDDTNPLLTFSVKRGEVTIQEPRPYKLEAPRYRSAGREIGLPRSWYDEFAARVSKHVERIIGA